MDMMRNTWLSGTKTNLLSTSWFIQHLEQLPYLQPVLPLSEFLADRTDGRAYDTVLRPSVIACLRYVLWLNGAP